MCDKQENEKEWSIEAEVEKLFMHEEKGLEDLVIKNTTAEAIEKFVDVVDWPDHLKRKHSDLKDHPKLALYDYFKWAKGNMGIADFLCQCTCEDSIPEWIRDVCKELKDLCQPTYDDEEEETESVVDEEHDVPF